MQDCGGLFQLISILHLQLVNRAHRDKNNKLQDTTANGLRNFYSSNALTEKIPFKNF